MASVLRNALASYRSLASTSRRSYATFTRRLRRSRTAIEPGLHPHPAQPHQALGTIRWGNVLAALHPRGFHAEFGLRGLKTDSGTGKKPSTDDYVQELEDLYQIAQDELEIASESTAAATVYAESDRTALREAFDDLDRKYAQYVGRKPTQPMAEQSQSSVDAGIKQSEKNEETTSFYPERISSSTREEITRRVGHRIRELRNAVETLEESAQNE